MDIDSNIMFFKFKNENFTTELEFKKDMNDSLHVNNNEIHFVIEIKNYSIQRKVNIKTNDFISLLCYSLIHHFFNSKIDFQSYLYDYYNNVSLYSENNAFNLEDGVNHHKITESKNKLSKSIHKYKDIFVNSLKYYDDVHDEYYEYCKMNNIQNFIKISVDYKLKYDKLANIIKEATYEHILFQYV